MTHFLKLGQWTFNLDRITRFYDHLPEKNLIEVESGNGGPEQAVQFWNEHADTIREYLENPAGVSVIDLVPKETTEAQPRKTWDGVTFRDKHELQNVIGVHEETIATQSKLIAGLRESIEDLRTQNGNYLAERDAYASTALAGLSAFGCTPMEGYVKDGGISQMGADFKRAHAKLKNLKESHERVNKANVGLLNQLIGYDAASRELLANASWLGGMATVVESDLAALREVRRGQQAVRIHPESTEADHA